MPGEDGGQEIVVTGTRNGGSEAARLERIAAFEAALQARQEEEEAAAAAVPIDSVMNGYGTIPDLGFDPNQTPFGMLRGLGKQLWLDQTLSAQNVLDYGHAYAKESFGDGTGAFSDALLTEAWNNPSGLASSSAVLGVMSGDATYGSQWAEIKARVDARQLQMTEAADAATAQLAKDIGKEYAKQAAYTAAGYGIGRVVAPIAGQVLSRVAAAARIGSNAFRTAPNTAYFWSGLGRGGASTAAGVAEARGGTTLEMFIKSRNIKLPTWDASNPASVKAWAEASRAFAQGASGEVRAVLGKVRPDSIWRTVELPALQANSNVTRIIAVNPRTGAEKVLWTQP